MPSATPSNSTKKNRTPAVIALSIATFLLFAIIFAQATFKLTLLDPDTSEETLIFAALSALIFLLFVALVVVLIRTLLRLYAERKTGVLGSKFRSRMVMGALLMSLGPVIFLFMFSYGLMNRRLSVVLATGGGRAVPNNHCSPADRLRRRQCAAKRIAWPPRRR